MKNFEIHDLINLKARRQEIEVGLGISNVDRSHLSKAQRDHIKNDYEARNPRFSVLNNLNKVIKAEEQIIYKRH